MFHAPLLPAVDVIEFESLSHDLDVEPYADIVQVTSALTPLKDPRESVPSLAMSGSQETFISASVRSCRTPIGSKNTIWPRPIIYCSPIALCPEENTVFLAIP